MVLKSFLRKCFSREVCKYTLEMLWAPQSHSEFQNAHFQANRFFFLDTDFSKNNSVSKSYVFVLSLQVYFRKGKVLQDAGFLSDALQLFLQCLALDEDFAPAKLEVEKVISLPILIVQGRSKTQVFLKMLIRSEVRT